MNINKRLFFGIAVFGFVLSVIVHAIAVNGIYINGLFDYVWFLHILVFVVFIPTLLILQKHPEYKQRMGLKNFYKVFFKDKPQILTIMILFFLIYAGINFMLFMQASEGGGPEMAGGRYILELRGEFIRELTEAEYYKFKANEVRGFSGHWMLFYLLPVVILWPGKNNK